MNLLNTCDNQLLIDIFLQKEKFSLARQERSIYFNCYYNGYDSVKVFVVFNNLFRVRVY